MNHLRRGLKRSLPPLEQTDQRWQVQTGQQKQLPGQQLLQQQHQERPLLLPLLGHSHSHMIQLMQLGMQHSMLRPILMHRHLDMIIMELTTMQLMVAIHKVRQPSQQ